MARKHLLAQLYQQQTHCLVCLVLTEQIVTHLHFQVIHLALVLELSFASILAAFLFIFAFILAGFVTRKAIFRDPETTFLNSFDRFGRLTSLALPILLVTILLGAIGLVAFPGFLFYVVYFLFALANLFTIVPVTTAWKADKFYQMILAALLNGVILSILFAIVFAIMSSFTVGLLF